MRNYTKNLLIGIFVACGIAGIILLIIFVKPSLGDKGKALEVRFSNISGINVGTRVTLAGRPVGEVTKISPIKDARQDKADELGRVYFYQLTLKVDSSIKVYNTDEICIQTTGLLGEKSIGIIPKAPKKGQKPKLITKQVIYANSVEPLENAMFLITQLADHLTTAIDDFNQWFVENSDDLSHSVHYFAESMKEIDKLLSTANKEDIVTAVKEAISVFTDNMQYLKTALEQIQENEMVAKVNFILDNFTLVSESLNIDGRQILNNLNVITYDLANGVGSLGKFIKSDDFYLQTTAILTKANTMMNDINHYGLLFQYDKHWQRTREKRATLLTALQSPKEFKHYFQTEMDGITTSLARISVLVDKAENSPEKEQIFESPIFRKDFSTLLRQVEELLGTIKLYNEQLMDASQQNCD